MKENQSCCRGPLWFSTIPSAVQQVSSVGSALSLTAKGLTYAGQPLMPTGLHMLNPTALTKDKFKCCVWDSCEKQVGMDLVKITVPSANPGPFTRQIGLFSPLVFVGTGKILKKKCRCSWWWFTTITNYGKIHFSNAKYVIVIVVLVIVSTRSHFFR